MFQESSRGSNQITNFSTCICETAYFAHLISQHFLCLYKLSRHDVFSTYNINPGRKKIIKKCPRSGAAVLMVAETSASRGWASKERKSLHKVGQFFRRLLLKKQKNPQQPMTYSDVGGVFNHQPMNEKQKNGKKLDHFSQVYKFQSCLSCHQYFTQGRILVWL